MSKQHSASLSGAWADEASATECAVCNKAFSLLRTKAHCKQCGQVVCKHCSSNKKELGELGKRRVCDLCFREDVRKDDDTTDEGTPSEGSEDEAMMRAVGALSVYAHTRKGKHAEVAGVAQEVAAADRKLGNPFPDRELPAIPVITVEESVVSLHKHKLDGDFLLVMTFSAVEGVFEDMNLGAFKKAVPKKEAGRTVKPGSVLKMRVKTAIVEENRFLLGWIPDGGPFGEGGTLKGCVQFTDGTALFVLDFLNNKKYPHEFKLNGMMDHTAEVHGYFTGSELVDGGKSYEGTYSLTEYLGSDADDSEEEEATPRKKKAADSDSSDSDSSASNKKKKKKAAKPPVTGRRASIEKLVGKDAKMSPEEWNTYFADGFGASYMQNVTAKDIESAYKRAQKELAKKTKQVPAKRRGAQKKRKPGHKASSSEDDSSSDSSPSSSTSSSADGDGSTSDDSSSSDSHGSHKVPHKRSVPATAKAAKPSAQRKTKA